LNLGFPFIPNLSVEMEAANYNEHRGSDNFRDFGIETGVTNYHEGARRISAHNLKEGKYVIVEDTSVQTRYGPMRSIAVRPLEAAVVVSYIPRGAEAPEGSLVGRQMVKKDLESKYHHPCHGNTYALEFY
jgi:hypothetical protein